ncbi:MAG TPA: HAMP domain-containing sensor histidine kinase [Sphingomicrobium sp.]
MRSWRTSAAYRIAFANFIAFALGLALLGVVVFAVMHIDFSRQIDAMMTDEVETLTDEYRVGGQQNLADAIAEREASGSPTRMLYGVFTPDGRRILGALQANRPPLGMHDIAFVDPNEGPDTARALAVDLSPSERLVVAADREWIERIDDTVVGVFGAAFIVACLLALAGAGILGSYLQQRLRSISRSAEAIIAGDIRERMPVSARRDEFDQLAITLNRMLDRIEGLLENLRQVSSDVAHDLRTPLARLRTRLEQGVRQNEGENGVLEDAIVQVDEVLSLFAAILRISEVESGQPRRFFAAVDVSALVTDLGESYAPAVHDGGRELFWSVEPGLVAEGDRELLAQAVVNLIENAQSHTPKGTIIRLTAVLADGLLLVQVADNGPGVPNADLHRVVRRFARLESSRNTSGYGLGLNLVSAVAALHGGRLILKNAAPGLTATIELPGTRVRKLPAAESPRRDKETVH